MTERPGPSYLTESVYYHGEDHGPPTPAPEFGQRHSTQLDFEEASEENFQSVVCLHS